MDINYFQFICFFWAAIGITSRIAMVIMGERWKVWEMDKAYREERPVWIYAVAVAGYAFVAFTWYQVAVTSIPYSYIIAILISSTVVKISVLLFDYSAFRSFAVRTLNQKSKMMALNAVVVMFSLVLVGMGVVLY